jgi:hypothetical protein
MNADENQMNNADVETNCIRTFMVNLLSHLSAFIGGSKRMR